MQQNKHETIKKLFESNTSIDQSNHQNIQLFKSLLLSTVPCATESQRCNLTDWAIFRRP